MVARELEQFFGSFSPDGRAAGRRRHRERQRSQRLLLERQLGAAATAAGSEVRFRDVEYAEDQAFARDAAAAGWKKAYVPAAAVMHAHDFGFVTFMRRYFDEYRGLRATIGHVEPASPTPGAGQRPGRRCATISTTCVQPNTERGRRLAGERGPPATTPAGRCSPRSGRARSASRARCGGGCRWKGTAAATAPVTPAAGPARAASRPPDTASTTCGSTTAASRPRCHPPPRDDGEGPLHIAWVIPPFRRGSGGHMTIFNIVEELERKGHSCSIWVHDPTSQARWPRRDRASARSRITSRTCREASSSASTTGTARTSRWPPDGRPPTPSPAFPTAS